MADPGPSLSARLVVCFTGKATPDPVAPIIQRTSGGSTTVIVRARAAVQVPDGGRADTARSVGVDVKLLLCLLPDFDQASVTVVEDTGEAVAWVQVGPLASRLDELQRPSGEGPRADALREARRVEAPDLQRESRWPAYVAAATDLGLMSQLATPLRWADEEDARLGVLTLSSTTRADIDASAPVMADVVAAQIVRTLVSLQEIERLTRALTERTVIGQACGLVMAWLDLDADHAFAYLRGVSARQEKELVLVAGQMVSAAQPPPVRPW